MEDESQQACYDGLMEISVLHAIKGSRAPEFRPKIVPKICKEIRKPWDASTKKPLTY